MKNYTSEERRQQDEMASSALLDEKIDRVLKEDLGGFGKYQIFIVVIYLCYTKSIATIMLNLSFLEKVPQEYICVYEGFSQSLPCQPEDFCSDPTVVSYTPNMQLKDSFDNWVGKLSLTCASHSQIGMIGSAYFFGWIITLAFLPRISDLYGRQKIIIGGNFIQVIAFTVIMVTQSYRVMIMALIVLGMVATARAQVSVIYLYESLTNVDFVIIYSICSCMEGVFGLLGSVYFMYLSKNWFWLLFAAYILQIIGTIGVYFFPESPKYLIKSGQLQAAQSVLELIAKVNGKDPNIVSMQKVKQLLKSRNPKTLLTVENVDEDEEEEADPSTEITSMLQSKSQSPQSPHEEESSLIDFAEPVLEEKIPNRCLKSDHGLDQNTQIDESNEVEQQQSRTDVQEAPGIMYFLRQRTILVNLILMTVVWITSVFNFYMINLQVKYFPGDFTVNMMVMTGSDIPACLLAGYLVQKYSARTIFTIFFALQSMTGMSILLFISTSNPGPIFPLLVGLIRFGIVAGFTSVWISHPRMFPTLFAATSLGIANFASRGLVILAPLVAEIAYPTPMILLTAMTIVAGFCSIFLIEEASPTQAAKKEHHQLPKSNLHQKHNHLKSN